MISNARPPGLATSAPPAASATPGLVKLTTEPADPANPVAVSATDGRMWDSRTPKAHTHTQAEIQGLETALANLSTGLVPHTHPMSDIVGLSLALAAKVDATDARLSDTRTPSNGSVDASKVAGSLKPSGTASAATEALRALGTGTTQAAAGDDARFPTSGQKNALAGSNGTPGTTNVYVTNSDPRLSDSRAPTAHTHPQTEVTGLAASLAAKVDSSDSRLSDARTPTAHTHAQSEVTGLAASLSAIPNASYRTILDSSGSHTAARVAGTYGMGHGDPLAITGTGTLYPLNTIYVAVSDFPTLNGVPPKLRLRLLLYVNDVAPTGNFTVGLHPVTRPATSGAAGLVIYTIGAAVAGSTATVTAPVADSSNVATGTDFALPADGHYVIGIVTTAAVATSSHLHLSAQLQMRNA